MNSRLHAAASPAGDLIETSRPLVIAHRGYSVVAPENTLAAFRRALHAGADLVELDYHHSRDGVPVVIHDSTLDRTTDALERWGGKNLRVDTRSADELKELRTGLWFAPSHPAEKVPLLANALDLIQSGSVTLIERKAGDAATLVGLLLERDLINKVVVQSFDWEYIRDFHRLEPRQVLGALGPPGSYQGRKVTEAERPLNAEWIEAVSRTGAKVVVWNRDVSSGAVAAAHARGLKVWVYTINDEALAAELLRSGVDGIITDNLPLIWRVVALHQASSSKSKRD